MVDRDKAYTPRALARSIVTNLIQPRLRNLDRFWEPCCGGGSFTDPLSELLPGAATDLDSEAPGLQPKYDPHPKTAHPVSRKQGPGDQLPEALRAAPSVVVVTNPPYSQIQELLRAWLQEPKIRLIGLLLLQTWITPGNRRDLVWGPTASIRSQTVLYPRPKFYGSHLGNNSYSQESSFLIWERGQEGAWHHSGLIKLERLEWSPDRTNNG